MNTGIQNLQLLPIEELLLIYKAMIKYQLYDVESEIIKRLQQSIKK